MTLMSAPMPVGDDDVAALWASAERDIEHMPVRAWKRAPAPAEESSAATVDASAGTLDLRLIGNVLVLRGRR